jgi:hypothetical protein
VVSRIRQMAYICEPEAFDATIEYWNKVLGVGPFWLAEVEPKDQVHRGRPTNGRVEVAVAYVGDQEIELMRPLNNAPSAWTERLPSDAPVPPAGRFHHFMIETDDYDGAVKRLLAGGCEEAWSAVIVGNRRVAYLDGRDTFGCWVELIEWRPLSDMVTSVMQRHSRNWDGTELRRSYMDVVAEAKAAR